MRRTQERRRLGRPPNADPVETENRIIGAARRVFANRGYALTTNQQIAALAEISPSTIYHYFESKDDLFFAAAREASSVFLAAFQRAASNADSLVGQIQEMFHAALALLAEDASYARFAQTLSFELQRDEELRLAASTAGVSSPNRFFASLVARARERGEIVAPISDEVIVRLISVLTAGLADLAGDTSVLGVASMVRAIDYLLAGKLFEPGEVDPLAFDYTRLAKSDASPPPLSS
jgi:AcrR family transcriptional regulator